MTTWIGCHRDHYQAGRLGKIDSICLHLMDGTLLGTDGWFRMGVAERQAQFDKNKMKLIAKPSSAHYGIGLAGELHQYVMEADTAYHAGNVHNPTWPLYSPKVSTNARAMGIEHAGRAGKDGNLTAPMPELQLAASVELVARLCRVYHIPCDRAHIFGHREVYSLKSCPGLDFPIDEIVALAASKLLEVVS